MAVDFAEKEREFLDNLAADTGRDLAGWMEAIAAANPGDRNAIIDWLRTQGFLFAKASWLERIHHNGGRPIYLESAYAPHAPEGPRPAPRPASPVPPPVSAPRPADPAPHPPSPVPPPPQAAPALAPPVSSSPSQGPLTIEELLNEAKAYRPLAQFVLKELEKAIPGLSLLPAAGYVALGRDGEFGALTIAPRELRLALAFGGRPVPDLFVKARFAKTHAQMPASLSHMIVLTDARQVTPALIAAVRDLALANSP